MKTCFWRRLLADACILPSLALGVACAAEESDAPAASSKPYDLYLLIGQSNMAGRGKVDAESKRIHPRVFTLSKDGRWVPATDPLHFDKPGAGVGPGLTFGKAMADASPESVIGLIPCAVGGAAIALWAPGIQDPVTKAFPYDDMLKRARRACQDGALKGILWHQGEADRHPAALHLYAERLTELIARLRKDLNAPEAPFIAGELGYLDERNREATAQFNAVLRALERTVANYAVVSAEGLKDGGDRLHFDAESARALGARYAEALLRRRTPGGEKPNTPKKDSPDRSGK